MHNCFVKFVKCTPVLYKDTQQVKNAPQILGEREKNKENRKNWGKKKKRGVHVIRGIMFDRKRGGNFEERKRNI